MDLSGIAGLQQLTPTIQAKNSTNTKAGSDLNMTDFLTLMVAMFQNQDIDNAASTSDMMNQMVQMSLVQAISDIRTQLGDSTMMTYAASLVGKEVVVGQSGGGEETRRQGVVTGTGSLNGQQIIFMGDESYLLSDVMAVGKLPTVPLPEADPTDEAASEPAASDSWTRR